MTVRYLSAREIAFRSAVARAIESALAGNWKGAAEANQQAVTLVPGDVESHNRLGKALAELDRIKEAIEAYETAARLDPHNSIARRNLDRLNRVAMSTAKRSRRSTAKKNGRAGRAARRGMNGAGGETQANGKVRAGAFLTDRAKSIVTQLRNLAPASVLAVVAPGDVLTLEPDEGAVAVTAPSGEYLGTLDPRLGTRLARLMAGGNRYEAVVASSTESAVASLIREVYRAPALARQASFPESRAHDEGDDQDDPDAGEFLEDELNRPYAVDDEEQESLSQAAHAERLNALLARPGANRNGGPLAV